MIEGFDWLARPRGVRAADGKHFCSGETCVLTHWPQPAEFVAAIGAANTVNLFRRTFGDEPTKASQPQRCKPAILVTHPCRGQLLEKNSEVFVTVNCSLPANC